MLQMEEEDYKLYGKTGQGAGIGWFVGYIIRKDTSYVFVTNMSSTSAEAKQITLDILRKYELIQ